MKVACPHCTQRLELDESWLGRELRCPTCAGAVLIPAAATPLAAIPATAWDGAVRGAKNAAPASRSRLQLERWQRGRKIRQAVAVAAVAGLLALGFGMRHRLAEIFPQAEKATASGQLAAAEEAVEVPAEVPVAVMPEPDAAADQTTAAGADAVASAGALQWLLADKSRWPSHVTLAGEAEFPAVFRGRAVGKVRVPAGTRVEVAEVGPDSVALRFRGGGVSLPHGATDLIAAVPRLMRKAEALAAPPDDSKPAPAAAKGADGAPAAEPRLVAAAKGIDSLLAGHHRKRKVQRPALVGDERFLRRTYLSAVGRIPTAEEASEFLADQSPHKRANLVSTLVKSPGYVSHMANWMFDRFRIVDHSINAQIRYPLYRRWMRAAIDQDVPWDRVVNDLLTAQGGGWDEESAAVGYFTRDRGMPLDNLAVTMRIFLGSRMECAQCHDDPFGDTRQKDFFRLAAFTNGQDPIRQDVFYPIFREMDAMPRDSVEHNTAWMLWRDVYGNSLGGGGTGRIALPMDYKYKDAKPGDIEGARAPFGEKASFAGTRDRDDGREKLAEWITQGTGDRFAGMIANNMWRRVMGAGYFEPGDEYLEPAETYEPGVSAHLAKLMKDLRYSLRDFQHVLMLTEAFQYEPNPGASLADGGADDYRGRRVQRMTAEQVWDSLVTLVSGNPDNQPPRETDETVYVQGRPVLRGRMSMAQLSREVLAIEDEKDLRAYFMDLVGKIKADDGSGGGEESMAATMRPDPLGFVRGMHPRAADLPSPAPRDHFVALFGQSTRNVVDGATREPNMSQVLSLMNGFVQSELINKPDAHLNRDLERASTPEEKIRQLYLGIFSREPSADELALIGGEFESSPEAAAANVASAMIMSAEFLYIQ